MRGEIEARGRWRSIPLALLLVACHFTTFPDPNDPSAAGILQPDVLRRQLKGASDSLLARVASGEITDAQYRALLADYARKTLEGLGTERIDPRKAWEYGEAFRTARLWTGAEKLFRIAAKAAPDEDRRVNDNLHLAEALAHLGRVPEAISAARSTFDVAPTGKVPILYGVLYEIAPAAQGHGRDAELAKLLDDAIRQAELTQVDPNTPEGGQYVMARPHHVRNARRLAAELFLKAGKSEEAERVLAGKLSTIRV